MYDSGNELAAFAAKQINYHVMGYYPITPSTQIAENLDVMGAEGLHDIAPVSYTHLDVYKRQGSARPAPIPVLPSLIRKRNAQFFC